MPALWCGTSSAKCILLWHHFLSKIVIIRAFSSTNWFNFIWITPKNVYHLTSQYVVLPATYRDRIVTTDYRDVTLPYVCCCPLQTAILPVCTLHRNLLVSNLFFGSLFSDCVVFNVFGIFPNKLRTIQYDREYLACAEQLISGQFNLPHGTTNRKKFKKRFDQKIWVVEL